MVSPCPPKTKVFIFLIGVFNSCERKYLNLDESSTPAIPTILFEGKPEYFCKAITITSSGFVIHITNDLGEFFFMPSATCLMIFKFIPNKSSLLIPGFLGTPAVMIITSEFWISWYLLVPIKLVSEPLTPEDWAISNDFPFEITSAISIKTCI